MMAPIQRRCCVTYCMGDSFDQRVEIHHCIAVICSANDVKIDVVFVLNLNTNLNLP